ncbi:MAG: hypothetical protein ACRETH_12990, partial [Steroidobacteraceae bacterium]
VYAVEWSHVQAFIRAPYRKSLSLEWFRAYGALVPEEGRDDSGTLRRRAMFLDAAPHWGQAEALAAVEADRARLPVISPEPPEPVAAPTLPAVPLTKEERLASVRRACAEGVDNQLRKKPRKWGARR